MRFTVDVDSREVKEALEKLEGRQANKVYERGTKKGAVYLAQKARPEAPVGEKPKPANQRLKRTISARKARRDGPGAVVVVRARHRHLVIKGTAERFDGGASRGVMPSNPFMDRVADQHGATALARVDDAISAELDLD